MNPACTCLMPNRHSEVLYGVEKTSRAKTLVVFLSTDDAVISFSDAGGKDTICECTKYRQSLHSLVPYVCNHLGVIA